MPPSAHIHILYAACSQFLYNGTILPNNFLTRILQNLYNKSLKVNHPTSVNY